LFKKLLFFFYHDKILKKTFSSKDSVSREKKTFILLNFFFHSLRLYTTCFIALKYLTMKTTKKIIKIGDSQGIVIDKPLLNNLKLNTGDLVEINVKKIKVEN
jgi:hypothetical protein